MPDRIDQLAATVRDALAWDAATPDPVSWGGARADARDAVVELAARATQADEVLEAIKAAGLPADAGLDGLIRHHRNNAAYALGWDKMAAEAEAARLREQLDAAVEREEEYMRGNLWVRRAAAEQERAEAAEARCAQLEQALKDAEVGFSDISVILEAENEDYQHRAYRRACDEWKAIREALAGPDTPADSLGLDSTDIRLRRDRTPADSQEDKT